MKVIGITGGIGMGKSTAGDLLLQRGFPVLDTDTIARQIVEPGEPALAEIVQSFGDVVMDATGRLRRGELARIVFANPEARRRLESILHPRIRKIWQAEVDGWRQIPGTATCGFVLIPLLFETDAASAFDAVVCVACSELSQNERLQARGWSAEEIAARKASQWPVTRKMDAAAFVVWTDTSRKIHGDQWDELLRWVG